MKNKNLLYAQDALAGISIHDKEISKNRKLIKKMVRTIASCETKEHIENTDKLISTFHLKYNDDILNRTFRILLYYHECNLSKI